MSILEILRELVQSANINAVLNIARRGVAVTQPNAVAYSNCKTSPVGFMTVARILVIYELIEKFGNRYINLISRQEISITFVRKENFKALNYPPRGGDYSICE